MKNYFRVLGGVLLFGFLIISFLRAAEEGSAAGEAAVEVTEDAITDCAICLRALSERDVQLSCEHRFHSRCIRQWFDINRSCPLCRRPEGYLVGSRSDIVDAAIRDDFAEVQGMFPAGLSERRIMALLKRRNGRGCTALHVAAERNNIVLATYLLGLLSRMNKVTFIGLKDRYGESALHKASALGHVEIANLLLSASDCCVEQRKLIEQEDCVGRTPLFMAMWKKRDEAVSLLRKYLPKKGSLRELRIHSCPCLYALLTDVDE